MASPQVGELFNLIVSSPKGLAALILASVSFVGLLYMFVSKLFAGKSPSKQTKRSTKSNQQSPKKSSATKQASKSPAKKDKQLAGVSKKTGDKDNLATKKASTKQENAADRKATKTSTPSKATENLKKNNKTTVDQKKIMSSQNQNEGEWITVATKKKSRSTQAKKQSEEVSAPKTRSDSGRTASLRKK